MTKEYPGFTEAINLALPEGELNKFIQFLRDFSNEEILERKNERVCYLNSHPDLSIPLSHTYYTSEMFVEPTLYFKVKGADTYPCFENVTQDYGQITTDRQLLSLNAFSTKITQDSEKLFGKAVFAHPLVSVQYQYREFRIYRQKIHIKIYSNLIYGVVSPVGEILDSWTNGLAIVQIDIAKDVDPQISEPIKQRIINMLKVRSVSIKEQAYNYYSKYIGLKYGQNPDKEDRTIEIESKFIVNPDLCNPWIEFGKLKDGFCNDKFQDYKLQYYPFTLSSASINEYYRRFEDGKPVDGLKILNNGVAFSVTIKANTKVFKDKYGLNCVTIRDETKVPKVLHAEQDYMSVVRSYEKEMGKLRFSGRLFRNRLAFWPENEKTGRIFHVSLDRCQNELNGEVLYQLEIEYTGVVRKVNFPSTEEEIILETVELTKMVYDYLVEIGTPVTPTSLTKFNWIS